VGLGLWSDRKFISIDNSRTLLSQARHLYTQLYHIINLSVPVFPNHLLNRNLAWCRDLRNTRPNTSDVCHKIDPVADELRRRVAECG
jgi:hypothetical protein